MAYRVDLSPRATKDLHRIYARTNREAPLQGPSRFDRFEQAILALEKMPERCPGIPALSTAKRAVRRLLFGKRRYVYRVYFSIAGEIVTILHVRHGARRDLERL